jgi:hypothetical protein
MCFFQVFLFPCVFIFLYSCVCSKLYFCLSDSIFVFWSLHLYIYVYFSQRGWFCKFQLSQNTVCFGRYWLSVGAQPTDTVRGLLYNAGIMQPPTPAWCPRKGHKPQGCGMPLRLLIPFSLGCPCILIFLRSDANIHVNWQILSGNTEAWILPFCQPRIFALLTWIHYWHLLNVVTQALILTPLFAGPG